MEGKLHMYNTTKRLVCFMQGSFKKVILYIGGLTDGLMCPKYVVNFTTELNQNEWSFAQVLLSSSYLGYGVSSLAQDAEEIDSCIRYLVDQLHITDIVLCGHSTGSQDSIQYLKSYASSSVKAIILQGPVSDREYSIYQKPEQTTKFLQIATEMLNQGKNDELLPRDADTAPITSYRYHSLNSRLGDDDMFSSDFSDDELKVKLGHVNVPVLIIHSGDDEYAVQVDKKKITERMLQVFPNSKSRGIVIEGANHDFSSSEDHEKEFFKAVKDFVSSL